MHCRRSQGRKKQPNRRRPIARIIPAFTQFFDDNGDPLVNGFLQFLESGTNNTDKNTFADTDLQIANANPVPLDGAGRCPNVFGDGSYNVISFTNVNGSPGVQIQQFDPVGGSVTEGAFSDWNALTTYDLRDIVIGSDGLYYRSLIPTNQNNDPTSSSAEWENFIFLGVYNQSITYVTGDTIIDSNGHLYRSIVDGNLNNTPADNPEKWGDPTNIADLTAETFTHNMTSDADYTLTTEENLNGRIIITDTLTNLAQLRLILVSTTERTFLAQNDTLQSLRFRTIAGTGVTVLAGSSGILYTDGVNVIPVGLQIATQAEVDAGANATKAVVPETLANSPQVAKAWVNFNGTGTLSVRDSFNVSSVTDNGPGDYTVNFTNNMGNADYVVTGLKHDAATTLDGHVNLVPGRTTSQFSIVTIENAAEVDSDIVNLAVFGN